MVGGYQVTKFTIEERCFGQIEFAYRCHGRLPGRAHDQDCLVSSDDIDSCMYRKVTEFGEGIHRHALSSQPVRVRIDDVYLLASPRDSANSTPEEDAARAQAAKMEKLENAELLSTQSSPTMSAEEEKKNQSFIESLTSKVTSNLQLEVSRQIPSLSV